MTAASTPAPQPETTERETPRELNRLEVLRGLRIATWEASFATVWASLTTGAFLTGYALWLGANSAVIGMVTAIPTFAGLIQLFSSYFGERLHERKKFTAWFSVIGRSLWLPVLLLPVLLSPALSLMPFLVLYALSYILLNVPVPAYMSWMSDLVPPDHRGRYFGRRNMIAGIVGMVIGLPAARFLDFATRQHHWERLGYGALFGVGVVGGLLSFVCLLRQPEPPKRAFASPAGSSGVAGVASYYKQPFADPNFRRMMLFNVVFGLGQNFAAPFFSVYSLQVLHLNFVWLQIFATMTSVASLASMPLWGYLADKFGNKPLLAIGVVGVFTLPITWIFTSPQQPLWTLLLVSEVSFAGGLFWAGVQLSQFNLLIRLSPPDKTPIYVAMMAAVTGLTGGLAPLVGSVFMQALAGWTGRLFGLTLTNYHVTFVIAAFLRLAGLLFLRSLVDDRAVSARDVLQQLTRSTPRAWLHIRQLQRGGDEEAKLRATGALAESRTRLAVAELENALTDPSQAVREEAARALGEIGDPSALPALLTALRDPASGIVAETARALERIGDPDAIPALVCLLEDAWETLSRPGRLEVVQALGVLGGKEAVKALLDALETACVTEAGDEEVEEALVLALGRTGDRHAVPTLIGHLQQKETRRLLRMALIRALGELGEPTALSALRATLAQTPPEDVIQTLALADALARLGDRESLLPLFDRLLILDSIVARKQVAADIGAILGEGTEIYNLLAQEAFARDAAITRLLQEIQRKSKTPTTAVAIAEVQEAFHAEDFARCARTICALSEQAGETAEVGEMEEKREACRRLLAHLAAGMENVRHAEPILLALFALRVLLS